VHGRVQQRAHAQLRLRLRHRRRLRLRPGLRLGGWQPQRLAHHGVQHLRAAQVHQLRGEHRGRGSVVRPLHRRCSHTQEHT
jgi:hypothetical protein